MPDGGYPMNVGAMQQDAEDAEAADEKMGIEMRQQEVGRIVDAHGDEHNKGEDIDLLVGALVVEEGGGKEIHTAAVEAGGHKRQHEDAAAEKQCAEERPERHTKPQDAGKNQQRHRAANGTEEHVLAAQNALHGPRLRPDAGAEVGFAAHHPLCQDDAGEGDAEHEHDVNAVHVLLDGVLLLHIGVQQEDDHDEEEADTQTLAAQQLYPLDAPQRHLTQRANGGGDGGVGLLIMVLMRAK